MMCVKKVTSSMPKLLSDLKKDVSLDLKKDVSVSFCCNSRIGLEQ